MSFIPRSSVVEPVVVDETTMLQLPETPSVSMPIRVYMQGQAIAVSDQVLSDDLVEIAGDWSSMRFEVDYFVEAASYLQRIVQVDAQIIEGKTHLVLAETPASGMPVRVYLEGQALSMNDVSVVDDSLVVDEVLEGYNFECQYFVIGVVGASVGAASGGGDGVGWCVNEKRIIALEEVVFGGDVLAGMVRSANEART